MLILPPIELCDYIELKDEKVIVKKEIPEELQEEFQKFKQTFETQYSKKD